jgi:hypothetical protein
MHKQFQEDRYLYWSVISAILQVSMILDVTTVVSQPPHRLMTRQLLQICVLSYTNSHIGLLHLALPRRISARTDFTSI